MMIITLKVCEELLSISVDDVNSDDDDDDDDDGDRKASILTAIFSVMKNSSNGFNSI